MNGDQRMLVKEEMELAYACNQHNYAYYLETCLNTNLPPSNPLELVYKNGRK